MGDLSSLWQDVIQKFDSSSFSHCLRDPKFSRFDTIPECDRHTHRHTTTAYTALSPASCGKNGLSCQNQTGWTLITVFGSRLPCIKSYVKGQGHVVIKYAARVDMHVDMTA